MSPTKTVGKALRRAIDAGAIPADSTVLSVRAGGAEWTEVHLKLRLWIDRSKVAIGEPGLWTLYVAPLGQLGLGRDEGGAGIYLPIAPTNENRYSASWSDPTAFHEYLLAARSFVRDCRDLVSILIQRDDVVRNGLKADLSSSFGARAVGALLLCHELGDLQAEIEVRNLIASDIPVEIAPGQFQGLRANAKRWLPSITKHLDVTLDL